MTLIAELVLDSFRSWMLGHCTYQQDDWSSLHRLHNDYALWSLKENVPLCQLRVFESLLKAEGCEIKGHLIRGLTLIADVKEEPPPPVDEPPLSKGQITAQQWLQDLLAKGACGIQSIRRESWACGFSWSTVLAAKRALGVEHRPAGVWSLPEKSRPITAREFGAIAEALSR